MSMYTTGEAAKLCGVSVRTVQYYDSRGILIPSELTEGGRRLYSETDIKKLKVICFLRELGISINGIGRLFEEENTENVVETLLLEQEKTLRAEIEERQSALDTLTALRRELSGIKDYSVEAIGDIANFMKTRNKLISFLWKIVLIGVPLELLEIGCVVLGVMTGIWWPLVIGIAAEVLFAIFASKAYYKRAKYVCPDCHHEFKPRMSEMIWAAHTTKTRKLRCPNCGKKSYCIEIYDESADTK